jgi:hypothetical protein
VIFTVKTEIVITVKIWVCIRGQNLTVGFTGKLFCLGSIATDSHRDVNSYKSATDVIFSMVTDSPRTTSNHSHSMVAGGLLLTS